MEIYALDIQLCSAIRRNLESRILGKEREIELVLITRWPAAICCWRMCPAPARPSWSKLLPAL